MSRTDKGAILVVEGLKKSFGAVVAAKDINLSFLENETIGIIGANGAGKTTFVNMVTGYLIPSAGTIHYLGKDITGAPPHKLARMGLCRSFQIPQTFMTLSVYENLLIALGIAQGGAFPAFRALDTPARSRQAEDLMKQYKLWEHRYQQLDMLSQGVRKLVDIAMATVGSPKLLLLDEPTSGISSEEKFDIMEIVMQALRQQQITVFFIEHDMDIVSRYSDRVIAFYNGRVIADGASDKVLTDKEVQEFVIGVHLGHEKLHAKCVQEISKQQE